MTRRKLPRDGKGKREGLPWSMIAAAVGWMGLSGVGLTVGGSTGGLILGFSSQVLVAYGLWQAYQQRNRSNDGGE